MSKKGVIMLMPKRVKWRKQMRGRMKGKSYRGAEVIFGDFGLKAMEPGWVTARQIEAARRAIVRAMKRRGKFWIRIFPDKPVTHKPAETRMGKGKATWNTGWRLSARAGSCSRSAAACRKKFPAKRCAWPSTSWRSRPRLLAVTIGLVEEAKNEPRRTKKLRDASLDELHKQLNDAREELMKLRFQQATGELTDFTRLRHTRRQIARLMTILNEREQEAAMEVKNE